MALTPTEEAQTRDLIAQQSALLSLAGVEPTILSKLGATKVTLSDLPSASVINDADLLLLRQGTADKSVSGLTFKGLIPSVPDATDTVKGIVSLAVSANFPSSSDTEAVTPLYLRSSKFSKLLPFSATLSSNTLVNTLSPTTLDFRPTSLNSGSYNTVNTGTLTLTAPTAASLGLTTLVQGRLALLVAYNGGTPVLCVSNLAGGLQLDEANLISPTTIGAGSTSANVIYSASSVSANSPYRVVGFVDVIWTSGTGFTTLTAFQGVGGQSLTALSSLGYSQSWQNLTGSRASGTTYYNTTGRPISVAVSASTTGSSNCSITVGGVVIQGSAYSTAGGQQAVTAIVPPNVGYSFTSSNGSINQWSELR